MRPLEWDTLWNTSLREPEDDRINENNEHGLGC